MIPRLSHSLIVTIVLALSAVAHAQQAGGAWEEIRTHLGNTTVSVAPVGDLDGDGTQDYAVAAFPNERVEVYSGASGASLLTLTPPGVAHDYGWSLCSPGDVDGDGIDDVLVGAPRADGVWSDEGAAYLHSGATGALLHEFRGGGSPYELGYSVAPIGDVDGDAVPDLLIGAVKLFVSGR